MNHTIGHHMTEDEVVTARADEHSDPGRCFVSFDGKSSFGFAVHGDVDQLFEMFASAIVALHDLKSARAARAAAHPTLDEADQPRPLHDHRRGVENCVDCRDVSDNLSAALYGDQLAPTTK